MFHHGDLTDSEVRRRIRNGDIAWAGNRRLKIYGRLDCGSGRRGLKRSNRVFFTSEEETRAHCRAPATPKN